MWKQALIILALVAIVALPFALRPAKPALGRADDTVIIITPHNEAIRSELGAGFREWYRARIGRTIEVDWRVIGGTSDITRHLESEYTAAFQNYWTGKLGKPWSAEVQGAFANPRLPADATPLAREAREKFLASGITCGLDLFCGGGSYDFVRQAQAGRIVPSRVFKTHPEWFTEAVIPQYFTGEQFWAKDGAWVGNVISTYGILYNADSLARLGITRPPEVWDDLADPRYAGELALSDATKSSSMAKAFENILQQKIRQRLAAMKAAGTDVADPENEAQAVRDGWLDGLRLIQRLSANARYFTDSSQKPPIDVGQGNCAASISIDFYARSQAEVAVQRGGAPLTFVTPRGGTVSSVDPIALLRGAPHREAAEAFIEYTLTLEAQKLWNFRPGTPGGPVRYALRRLPVRKDFYQHAEWMPFRSDPETAPFFEKEPLIYQPAWTAGLFRELAFVVRVTCLDPHDELKAAWRVINAASPEKKARALEKLGELAAVDYAQANGKIRATLNARNRVEEVRLANELGARFRAQYEAAAALARQP